MKKFGLIMLVATGLISCASTTFKPELISLKGQWVTESNGEVMLNPQTSGLKSWRGKLLSVSDGSAHISQRKQLHIIDPQTALVSEDALLFKMSDNVQQSCFADYLNDSPDLEALAVDPKNDKVIVVVTEDATRGKTMSDSCFEKYQGSGSTDYPSLLVRLELQDDNTLLITHAKPLQFEASYQIGNFPNDGLEGLAFGLDGTLYLGKEKDQNVQARVFSVKIDDAFWNSEGFAQVTDTELNLPQYEKGNHPINGMDYLPRDNHPGYLVAAARNDNDIWLIDLAKEKPTLVIPLEFYAPTHSTDGNCEEWELMNNASLEGVAVDGDRIWMINDPWKKNYTKNVICESNRGKYERMAPLLFSMPINPKWFH
ncbi:hypothetical protein Q4574_02695 [Aliiglaciecola sp. 3_MG-2023]|uniref:hypothetical protein n=1 Tax=Aliiglaciecola sp. 3_MG-2023 TaxID=3062644 RepID=UPI0026E3BB11|nr:hypothetical protein [Aliiglaciecola sp. 3_MG-2023]MDO6692172.1 hypothetical protein [Aliiglaciecola sp. 3_MG-2023]